MKEKRVKFKMKKFFSVSWEGEHFLYKKLMQQKNINTKEIL